ncbi:MAG: ATP-binding cassette domain-containing protein [Erysipelotrichaceae bacterium]
MRIQIKHLYKSFGKQKVLNDINLTINENEVTVLMGLSGSGKTTLLRCLCDLETIDSGEIIINNRYLVRNDNGKPIYANKKEKQLIRKDIGLVFQNYQLFPHRTVIQNIMDASLYHKYLNKEEALQEAKIILEKLKISDKQDCYPSFLSGGEKQRVAIARACILRPSILCFDEPTSALDIESIDHVANIIKDLSSNMAILIITHDEGFAQKVGSKLIRIKDINSNISS